MPLPQETFTLGVEEEYQILDPVTRQLSSSALSILPRAALSLGKFVQPEMQLSQLEVATPICHTLREVRICLQGLRRVVIEAARQEGKLIATAGTHPFSRWQEQQVTPKERYQGLARDYQQLSREQAIFGSHVHVGLRDREVALQVMNRARIWLSVLLALAASSPFWMGEDTGYASFRTEIWSRWPTSGPPLLFASLRQYQELVQALIATGAIADATKIYWDMRVSERFETVEFRVTDACTSIDEAVMIAGLARAIVRTCYEQARDNEPFAAVRPELLRMAHWHAARYGISDHLVDVEQQRLVSANTLIEKLLTTVRPALEAEGDWEEVSCLVQRIVQQGNGAIRQRTVYQQTGRIEAIVDVLVAETAQGTENVSIQ
ncbi:MAG: carboxylate-amine ligase [Chloroflexi bacterium]|nr:carboxylate-amine ligase [Chloroflexota bacterium]